MTTPIAKQNLSSLLDHIEARIDGSASGAPFTLDDLMSAIGRRSYGPLLLAIGLFAISPATIVPGMTWFAAAVTLIVAGCMSLGLRSVWLPAPLLRTRLPEKGLRAGIERFRPWARRIDAVLRPRLAWLMRPPFVNLIGVLCVGQALITFPLGFIPFAPLAPGAAIVFFGLGLTAHDGLWIGLGMAACVGAGLLAAPLILHAF